MSVARPRSPDGSSDARISHVKTSDVTNFRDVSSLCPAGAHCRRCIEKHGSAVSLDTCLVFRTCCMRNQLCSQAKLAVKKCNRCKFIKNGASWCRALTWTRQLLHRSPVVSSAANAHVQVRRCGYAMACRDKLDSAVGSSVRGLQQGCFLS